MMRIEESFIGVGFLKQGQERRPPHILVAKGCDESKNVHQLAIGGYNMMCLH